MPPGQLIIFNSLGRMVYVRKVSGDFKESVKLAGFGIGVYMARLVYDDQSVFRRIVIE
ncbi:MAG: T9SS type A sorting domain-containing protein [Bacteroidia bacterium]|nr:T9SS type A sorting domain-containing protein [Bacteroidia bacterium]